MSWESSQLYYQYINKEINNRLGGHHSAVCVMESVNFDPIARWMANGDWAAIETVVVQAVKNLELVGAECIVICTNTMHRFSPLIETIANIPLLHIASATANSMKEQQLSSALLLGTQFTMEQDFFKSILKKDFAIDTIVPSMETRTEIHRIIFDELVHGKINETSKQFYQNTIKAAQLRGVQAVILGCTEIPLLISQEDVDLPVFDTTKLHASAAVEFSLAP